MSATPTDTLREAVARAIRAAFEDEIDGKPAGNIISIGCEGASYLKPDDAANGFLASATDAALSAIEDAGWRIVPTEPTPDMVGAWYRYKSGRHLHDETAPGDTSDYGAYRAMISAAPRLDATVRGEEG